MLVYSVLLLASLCLLLHYVVHYPEYTKNRTGSSLWLRLFTVSCCVLILLAVVLENL